jgi:hypothetical protein
MDTGGFDAVVVHHEVDHLNGVLFIDRVSSPTGCTSRKTAPGGDPDVPPSPAARSGDAPRHCLRPGTIAPPRPIAGRRPRPLQDLLLRQRLLPARANDPQDDHAPGVRARRGRARRAPRPAPGRGAADFVALAGSESRRCTRASPTSSPGSRRSPASRRRAHEWLPALATGGPRCHRRGGRGHSLAGRGRSGELRARERPSAEISFEAVVEGLVAFSQRVPGRLWLEVLVLGGLTDDADEVGSIARIAGTMRLDRVQLNTVSRPPADPSALPVAPRTWRAGGASFLAPARSWPRLVHAGGPALRGGDVAARIVALVSRSPCTIDGWLAPGRAPQRRAEATGRARRRRAVRAVRSRGAVFYVATSPLVTTRGRTRQRLVCSRARPAPGRALDRGSRGGGSSPKSRCSTTCGTRPPRSGPERTAARAARPGAFFPSRADSSARRRHSAARSIRGADPRNRSLFTGIATYPSASPPITLSRESCPQRLRARPSNLGSGSLQRRGEHRSLPGDPSRTEAARSSRSRSREPRGGPPIET